MDNRADVQQLVPLLVPNQLFAGPKMERTIERKQKTKKRKRGKEGGREGGAPVSGMRFDSKEQQRSMRSKSVKNDSTPLFSDDERQERKSTMLVGSFM